MPLPALATTDDLTAYQVDVSDPQLAERMLAAASATIRAAAGSPISATTSTVTLSAHPGTCHVRLPGPPVTAVSTVTMDGQDVDDWRLDDGRLWRRHPWTVDGPRDVTVTYDHGLSTVPEDIVYLVCAYAAAGMTAARGSGIAARGDVVSERIDDYSVTYAQGADAVETVMQLPERTARRLRTRFGTSADMVAHR